MTKCCQTNTCVELVPSTCVRYTGTPTVGNLIDKQGYCDPYLNDIIKLLDDNVSELDVRVGLNKTAFDNANNACGLNPVISTTGLTVKDDKYYSSEVILRLTSTLCQVRSSLNYLTSKDINVLGTGNGNIHWEDLPLSPDFLTWLQDESCLKFQSDCVGGGLSTYPKTLGGLLKTIIKKLCTCCP